MPYVLVAAGLAALALIDHTSYNAGKAARDLSPALFVGAVGFLIMAWKK